MGKCMDNCIKRCIAGAMALALIGATTLSTGCANPNDPKVQARKQLAAARKAEEQARKQEEAERKREAQAAAKQAEIDRKNAIAMEKQQAKLAKEQRDREEAYARAHGGVSMYDPQGWNVDKAVGNAMMHGDYVGADWPTEGQVRAVDNHVQKAAARGAAEDSMLFAQHFDDAGDLNSLGRAKLDLLLSLASPDKPVYVYIPQDDQATARRAGVNQYLSASPRYGAMKLELREGTNDMPSTPAINGLNGLRRMEQQRAGQGGGGGSSGGGMGTGSTVAGGSSSASSSGAGGYSR